MPEAKNKATNLIIGTGLITAETIASELRARLTRYLGSQWRYLSHQELMARARTILSEFEPILAENFAATDLAAFLAGFDDVARKLPGFAIDAFGSRMGGPPRPPGGIILPSWYEGDDEPIVEFPLIQKAAEKLAQKNILTRYEFDRASQAAKNQAFTVAGDMTRDTLETIRDVLSETVDEGASLEGFRRNLGERIEKSFIGPGHLETVFRTGVQGAFAEGHDTLADHPIVDELFPYMEILPIHDARARPTHQSLAHLGLSSTGIYRRDDKAFWQIFRPPIEWNCRCGVNLLTIEAAARAGVAEASEWLRTGYRPPMISRLPFIPWRPDPKFVGVGRVAA